MLTAKTSTRSTALTFGNFGNNLTFLVAPPSESSDTKWDILYLPGWSAPNSAKTFPVLSDNNDYCHLVVLTVVFSHADISFCFLKSFYSSFKCSYFSRDADGSQCLSLFLLWRRFGVSQSFSLWNLSQIIFHFCPSLLTYLLLFLSLFQSSLSFWQHRRPLETSLLCSSSWKAPSCTQRLYSLRYSMLSTNYSSILMSIDLLDT